MFGIIILIMIGLLVRSAIQNAPELTRLLATAGALPQGGLTSPYLRCSEMADAIGTPWVEWDAENPESGCVPPTIRSQFQRLYYGPMDMEVAGDQVLIYDMQMACLLSQNQTHSLFHTVISIKPPELGLPPFILRPIVGFSREYLTGQSIKTGTALDTLFDTETLTPHRVKALFQSELGTEVLVPFLLDHRWTVEWTGKQLTIYELNRLIAPHQLAEVALEASEFFELLKSGPAVVDRMMKDFFDSAIATPKGTALQR